MTEKKKGASKGKGRATAVAKQRTLLDMFPKPVTAVKEGESSSTGSAFTPVESGGIFPLETNRLVDHGTAPAIPLIELSDSEVSSGDVLPDPIIIEDTPPPPSSAPPTEASSPLSQAEDSFAHGSSPSAPIVIDSSPVKSRSTPPPPMAIHPFFAPRAALRRPEPPPSPSKLRKWTVPYPDRHAQHVRGPQTASLPSKSLHPSRPRVTNPVSVDPTFTFLRRSISPESNYTPTNACPSSRAATVTIESSLDSIPKEHIRRHPSISRVIDLIQFDSDLPHSPCEAWTERWRPRTADHILGNEESARYLRRWLLALKLQTDAPTTSLSNERSTSKKAAGTRTTKRPRVITEIVRGRARKRAKVDSDDEDDWIVYSDEEDVVTDYAASSDVEDDFLAPISEPVSSPANPTPPPATTQDLGELHNTILLVGPPGTGKTASVYACAEELGWEVFEVYPGIGKRSGVNIEHLVGEVGKNHLVRQRPHGRHDFFTVLSPTKRKANPKPPSEHSQSNHVLPNGIDSTKDPQIPDDENPQMAQSLILLEEVDILFKEDSNFWSTVIKIIKECRRPVICTCNDVSLVPVLDLPIQKVLNFEPCPPDVAVSYLQSIACAEGRPATREGLMRLLEMRKASMEDEPGTRHWLVAQATCDLRHAINLLQVTLGTGPPQLGSATTPLDETGVPGPSNDDHPRQAPADEERALLHDKEKILGFWKEVAHEAETRSFLDSQMAQGFTGVPSIDDNYLPSEDDELGHPILFETSTDNSLPTTYTRHVQIQSLLQKSLPCRLGMGNADAEAATMLAKANMYKMHLSHVLHDVCPMTVWSLPLPRLYVDYAPYIKQVAEADDAQAEATIQRVQERGGRRTRNSGKSEYVRILQLSDLGRGSISRICFED
ncbi:hypothetical protein CC1G_00308 [Coprinopsis cinerea okayama7|uniref:ATPase AAA-type core domain-containing protein n=1 Tax=Coprinopsis cinerea (strain Okayama-7 / 130 / ATCC MYA-4618 / FGSC 9003) TaxID=240176 RepID=A8NXH8_COPC7|nr:hypothetical protein CC1G_00308 [Coprinopsis cinerea okayama7\|eukprot:XP_001837172.2 hypothetical protein CC1G_00308 [Coprinopsis cinerea okayama7\